MESGRTKRSEKMVQYFNFGKKNLFVFSYKLAAANIVSSLQPWLHLRRRTVPRLLSALRAVCLLWLCPVLVLVQVSNLQLNVTSITCPVPGCAGVLDPEHCRQILPFDVFVSWGNALSESVLFPESDIDSTFICDFCVEPVNLKDSFNRRGCTHFYCQGCIVKFIVSKLQDNVTRIMCPVPSCTGTLDLEYCRAILPKDVFDRWGKALCESVVMALMGPGKKNWERRVKTRCWKSLPRRRGGGGVQIASTMLKENIDSVTDVEQKDQVLFTVRLQIASSNLGIQSTDDD
ncbi:hypothetical protein C1H46_037364 [Malus baccata]|uniref:RING-type domain-containing protein n=1 Tax=Malus baccata TaxID=106549 RepID=A0A540KSA3_MALBA|nr:hypothetical protein C1H46_037364 [Malus baccata]